MCVFSASNSLLFFSVFYSRRRGLRPGVSLPVPRAAKPSLRVCSCPPPKGHNAGPTLLPKPNRRLALLSEGAAGSGCKLLPKSPRAAPAASPLPGPQSTVCRVPQLSRFSFRVFLFVSDFADCAETSTLTLGNSIFLPLALALPLPVPHPSASPLSRDEKCAVTCERGV